METGEVVQKILVCDCTVGLGESELTVMKNSDNNQHHIAFRPIVDRHIHFKYCDGNSSASPIVGRVRQWFMLHSYGYFW